MNFLTNIRANRALLRATFFLLVATATAAHAAPPDHWVGTWATAPMAANNGRAAVLTAAPPPRPPLPHAVHRRPPPPPPPAARVPGVFFAGGGGPQVRGVLPTALGAPGRAWGFEKGGGTQGSPPPPPPGGGARGRAPQKK